MIKKRVVRFVPNEIESIVHDSMFEIIDAELNCPKFGDLTLYTLENQSEVGGKYISNYIVAAIDVELPEPVASFRTMPSEMGTVRWQTVTDLHDSINRKYFLLVNKP